MIMKTMTIISYFVAKIYTQIIDKDSKKGW